MRQRKLLIIESNSLVDNFNRFVLLVAPDCAQNKGQRVVVIERNIIAEELDIAGPLELLYLLS